MNVSEKIKAILKIMELEKQASEACKDCEMCKTAKSIKDKIILLSAEVIAEQSKQLHGGGFDESLPPPKRTPTGNSVN